MNWFKFVSSMVTVGSAVAKAFVKNPESVKVLDATTHIVSTVVDGLASQNPDGTPASQPFTPTTPKV